MTSLCVKNRRQQDKPNQSGFTLIEVMVAVAVIAIALPALMINIMQQASGTAYARDKTIAQWVATNKMAEIRLINRSKGEVPKKKNEQGTETMAGRDWYWSVRSKEMLMKELKGIWGVEVTVRSEQAGKESSLATLNGIMHEAKALPKMPELAF